MTQEITATEKYSAALYIRLSKEDESSGPSQSVTNQRALLTEFADKHKLFVFDIYIDDGWSGTSFERPAFRRMVADIETRKVNMVITKDLSRLGRDYIMTGHYMERYFPEHRVRYISLLDGIDTGVDSTANDITPFRAVMNDMYAKDISKKIKSVKRDKQRRGEFIGGKPVYGYKMHPTEKNKIVVDEKVAPVVERIFSMALSGESCRRIAAALNADDVSTPAAYANLNCSKTGVFTGQWSAERISELLHNETYIGNMVQGRSMRISYKSKKSLRQPPEKWVVVRNTHQPLIDEESFEKVQKLLSSRRHTRSRTYDFMLKGLIFCHECGSPLSVLNRKNAAGEDVLYFVCRSYQRSTKAGVCTCHCVKEQRVNEAVINKTLALCARYLNRESLLSAAKAEIEKAELTSGIEAEFVSVRNIIKELNAKMDSLYMDRLSGLLSEPDFLRVYERLKQNRESLSRKLAQLDERKSLPANGDAAELVRRFIESAGANRELLVSLIERIELTKDRELIIKYRFCEQSLH